MTPRGCHSIARYLAAKKSVDDRSLNHHVWRSLLNALPRSSPAAPLQVLEVGAGIGTMVERLQSWGLLTSAEYTAVDADPDSVAEMRRRLPRWMVGQGFRVERTAEGRFECRRSGESITVITQTADLFDFAADHQGQSQWNLLIAQALLDVIDAPKALRSLLPLLRPGGLLYLTITFDGATIFQPEIDQALDAKIEELYHRTMDERIVAGRRSGDSKAGRHLFGHLRATGIEVLDAGGSDWVVFAGPHGYSADEAHLLHFIVDTIASALAGHPELDPIQFAEWITLRHAQIEDSTLVYIAHQLDVLGRKPAR